MKKLFYIFPIFAYLINYTQALQNIMFINIQKIITYNNRAMKKYQIIGSFWMGFRDSISIQWISSILFYTHPIHKKVNPESYKMLKGLKNSFIQVLLIFIGLPNIFQWLGFAYLSAVLNFFFLLLTYGWIFFYTDDLIVATRKVALWGAEPPLKTPFFKLNRKQNLQIFTSLAANFKSFIFLLLFYFPIFLLTAKVFINISFFGPCLLVISESFFNSTFYFLKLWPYDKYNIGFLEKNWSYMIGYGLTVSVICNILLSDEWARGGYFLISQWMIINCVLHGPAETQFETFQQVYRLETPSERVNSYNIHREQLRSNSAYRQEIVKQIKFLKPAMIITDFINRILSRSVEVPNNR